MARRHEPQRPGNYPIAWITAARHSLAKGKGNWVSCDWAKSPFSAANRMSRLRAFRDALKLYPQDFPDLAEGFAAGLDLAFRKQDQHDPWLFAPVWDVQLSWQEPPVVKQLRDAVRGYVGEGESPEK